MNRAVVSTLRGVALLVFSAVVSAYSTSARCGEPVVFEPHGRGVDLVYSSGVPFGIIEFHGLTFMVQMEPMSLERIPYARIWILCRNDSQGTIDFDPTGWLRYEARHPRVKGAMISEPEPGWSLVDRINAKVARDQAWIMFSSSITALTVALAPSQDSKTSIHLSGPNETYVGWIQHNDGDEKNRLLQRENREKAERELRLAQTLGAIKAEQLHQSVLRRDTLAPGMAVAGFVYLPFPQRALTPTIREHLDGAGQMTMVDTVLARFRPDFRDCSHEVVLKVPAGDTLRLSFVPVKGR